MRKLLSVMPFIVLVALAVAPNAAAGAKWVVSPSPDIGGRLNGVAAYRPNNVWTVGVTDRQKALAEHWDGTSWQLVRPVRPGKTSDLTAVWGWDGEPLYAVGYYTDDQGVEHGLVETWNGMNWVRIDLPSSWGVRRLDAVARQHGLWVGGVGASGHHVILRYTGTSWKGAIDYSFSGTVGDRIVGFASHGWTDPSQLWAIGDADNGTSSTAVLEHRFGNDNWQLEAQPSGDLTTLNGVGGHTFLGIWAVGSSGPAGSSQPIAVFDSYEKATWLPVATSASSATLMGVTTADAQNAWAVGSRTTSRGTTATLIEHHGNRASSFTQVGAPSPYPNADAALTSVAWTGEANDLWAVGYAGGGTLILHRVPSGG